MVHQILGGQRLDLQNVDVSGTTLYKPSQTYAETLDEGWYRVRGSNWTLAAGDD